MIKKTTRLLILAALIMVPAVAFAQSKSVTINVYFHNEKNNPNSEDCAKVYPTPRKIPRTKAVARAALLELFRGTTDEERAKEFWFFSPDETRNILKNVNVKGGVAYVNFTKAMYEQMGTATTSCGGSQFFSSVEKTLTQFPTIKKVFYAIEANPRDFYEWVQVGECPRELKNCDGRNFR